MKTSLLHYLSLKLCGILSIKYIHKQYTIYCTVILTSSSRKSHHGTKCKQSQNLHGHLQRKKDYSRLCLFGEQMICSECWVFTVTGCWLSTQLPLQERPNLIFNILGFLYWLKTKSLFIDRKDYLACFHRSHAETSWVLWIAEPFYVSFLTTDETAHYTFQFEWKHSIKYNRFISEMFV